MGRSKAATVDEFIAWADPARAPYLAKNRDAARRQLTGFVEDMRYGMPTCTRGEAGIDFGKSYIRFRKPAAIDFDLVEQLLRDTAALDAPIC